MSAFLADIRLNPLPSPLREKKCPGMTASDDETSVLEIKSVLSECPFIAITPRSTDMDQSRNQAVDEFKKKKKKKLTFFFFFLNP